MLEDWGLDDSRSWRPDYLRPGERAGERATQWREKRGEGREGRARAGNRRRERVGEIQASARAIGRRSGGRKRGDPGERAPSARGGGGAWDPGEGRKTLVVSSQRRFRSF